jgi:hypothetical protein
MASRFQQQSLTRKLIYLGLIVALFSVSLLHRRLVIHAQANELRLREEHQGEVELSGSAIRLTLSGLRGVVTTSLWMTAIDKQKKHQWNDLEVIVRSLTKLQPHFISPWLFQSWNLAFNVSVECDSPRDKYFYITRGLELLAEGERRNKGNEHADPEKRSPANPEMRFHMGFYYQLKIGQGDEQNTLKCLFDMSSVDPKLRNELVRAGPLGGKEVDLVKFQQLCESHPRLIRRLREKLGYESPLRIVTFLSDNREIPSRFEKTTDRADSPLKDPLEQFPILPPLSEASLPDARSRDFAIDADIFTVCRAWYTYAQIPLPPENPDVGIDNPADRKRFGLPELKFNRLNHRLPKMAQSIFRGYPARAQAYTAEHLQQEGWFDDSGWLIRDWFIDPSQKDFKDVTVGKGTKYHSGQAWDEAYRKYLDHGERNGLYLKPEQEQQFKKEAAEQGSSSYAAEKMRWYAHYRHMTNFPDFFHQSERERLPETVAARKKYFQAQRLHREGSSLSIAAYRDALAQWLDVLLQNPTFRQIGSIQEDTYEMQFKYLRHLQKRNEETLTFLMMGMARSTPVVGAYIEERHFFNPALRYTVLPLREVEGPYDWVALYEGSQPDVVRAVTLGTIAQPRFDDVLRQLSLVPLERSLTPPQERRLLLQYVPRPTTLGRGWNQLIPQSVVTSTRDRFDVPRPKQESTQEAPQK